MASEAAFVALPNAPNGSTESETRPRLAWQLAWVLIGQATSTGTAPAAAGQTARRTTADDRRRAVHCGGRGRDMRNPYGERT
jgi:hypothetical protein